MRHKEIFDKYFTYDTNSPTNFFYKGTNKPAGYKKKSKTVGYQWVIQRYANVGGIHTNIEWKLPRTIYEFANKTNLDRFTLTYHKDGNRDNLKPENIGVADNFIVRLKSDEIQTAFDNYRNVILSRTNPDYYKDPSEWTDPEAVALLAAEKQSRGKTRRALGKAGRPRKWK